MIGAVGSPEPGGDQARLCCIAVPSFAGQSSSLSIARFQNSLAKCRVRSCPRAGLHPRRIYLEQSQKREPHQNLRRIH